MDRTYLKSSLKTGQNTNGEPGDTQYHTPCKGLVLSMINRINARTQQQQASPTKLRTVPLVSQRQRSGSFNGPVGEQALVRHHLRLTKYASLSSLSTTPSSPDLGRLLDGATNDIRHSSGFPLGKRDVALTIKSNKLCELSSCTSSRLASTLDSTLPNAAHCGPLPQPKPDSNCEKSSEISSACAHRISPKLDTGDGVRDDFRRRETLHRCHYCGKTMGSRDPCSNCGHEFCPQCIEDETTSELLFTGQSAHQPQGLSRVWSPKHTFPDLNLLQDDQSYLRSSKHQSGYFPEGQVASANESDSERDTDSPIGSSSEQQSRSTLKATKRPLIRTAKSTPTLSSSPFTESMATPSRLFKEELEPSEHSTSSPPHHTLSLNSSCSISDQVAHDGLRHCFCCAARQPYRTLRATKSFIPETRCTNIPNEGATDKLPECSLSSPSDRSTANWLKSFGDVDLYPPALQLHRQDSIPSSITSKKQEQPFIKAPIDNAVPLSRSQEDPLQGHRRLQPHPHPPEPETEPWPQLRRVTRPISKRPEVPPEPIPWRRSALRKLPVGQAEEAPSPALVQEATLSPEQHEQLKVPDNPPEPLLTSPPQTPNTKPGRKRDTRAFFDRNRSESSKRGGLSAAHSARDPSLSSRGSGVSPRQIDSYQNSRASPQPSLWQVEKMLAQGLGQNGLGRADENLAERNVPDTSRKITDIAAMNVSPTRHSCGWKDRFMDLSAEVDHLKAELASHEGTNSDTDAPRGVATQTTPRPSKRDDSDTGIEGITIIIHLKGKDDLVINTDLREEQH